MNTLQNQLVNLSSLGLLWDGLGVFILGIPALLRLKSDIAENATMVLGWNPAEIKSLVSDKMDVSIGSVFLLIGFIMQLFATLKLQLIPNKFLIVWWLIPLLLIAYYYLYGKGFLVTKWTKEINSELSEKCNKKTHNKTMNKD